MIQSIEWCSPLRILTLALSLVREQQCLLKTASVDTSSIASDLDSLTHLADGDKGVAWADQTRISTNNLQDVSVASLSNTQQQLFDCFLEHSSPKMRGGFPRSLGNNSPMLLPSSLSILTPHHSQEEETEEEVATPILTSSRDRVTPTPRDTRVTSVPRDIGSRVAPIPRSSTASSMLTVRASHTISSTPHRSSADSAKSSTGSVIVTTDVCFSSDIGSDRDDLSEVSSSGVGSYTTSEPSQNDMDYDKLDKKVIPSSSTVSLAERTRMPAFDLNKKLHPPVTTSSIRSLYAQRPSGTPLYSTKTNLPREIPQPYSMFRPFQQQQQQPVNSSSGQEPPPPSPSSTLTSTLSSQHSISTDSGIGNVSAIPRTNRPPIIPNRPMANGFMVRSNPSTNYSPARFNCFEDNFVSPRQGHVTGHMKVPVGAVKSLPYSSQRTFPNRVPATPNPYVKDPSIPTYLPSSTSAPSLSAAASNLPRPSNSVVPRPSCVTASTSNLSRPTDTSPSNLPRPSNQPRPSCNSTTPSRIPHAYQSINVPPPNSSENPKGMAPKTTPTGTRRASLDSSPVSKSGPGSNTSDEDSNALNSTFTIAVGKKASHNRKCSEGSIDPQGVQGKKWQARGMFSRSKVPGKLPSYLKMTKSAESKKADRLAHSVCPLPTI